MTRIKKRPQRATRSCRIGRLLLWVGTWALVALFPVNTFGQASVARLNAADVELTSQNGKTGKFVRDFIGDRVVAITFTYTACGTICPVLDGIFKNLQGRIAEDLGKEVALITVSIDPVNDIPERLKVHAEKIGARPGWFFLTGPKDNVTRLLKSLDVFAADIYDHPPTVFVVDGRRGLWNRLNGFPSPKLIEQNLNEYKKAGNET